MRLSLLKRRLLASAMVGVMFIPTGHVFAAESISTNVQSKQERTAISNIDATWYVTARGVVHRQDVTENPSHESARKATRQRALQAAKKMEVKKNGQAVLAYARQFLGNPYVYGGTSLTNGTDCSGFVMGVYRHFGFSLPHSSAAMRNVGRAVSYSEIQPGDIICYSGHVGIYAGNGQIINAIDESHGIDYSNAQYANIITIRRMF